MLTNGIIELLPADTALAEEAADFYRRNRAFLRPFEAVREEAFFTAEHQRKLLEQEMEARRQQTGFRFYIRLAQGSEKLIGVIGLNNVVWGAFYSAHLGYKMDHGYINGGYMTMAVALITRFAFETLGLHRIEANVMPRNGASLRVLEKNGYYNEGISKDYLKINGVWEDHIHMVKLNRAMHEK